MSGYLHSILHYLQHHPQIGLLAAFLISFIEALPIIGTIFPGSITMTAIGALIGTGVLPATLTFICAILGAFLGDCVGFWFGRHHQETLRNIWPFKKYPKMIAYSEDFFQKHGGKSVILGRFVGPARSTVPLIAGWLNMSWTRFLFAAAPSATLWAVLYILPGILLGALSLEIPPGKTTEFLLIGLVVITFLWIVFWAIQRFFRELARLINRFIDATWDWLNRHHSSKFFIRLITNRADPGDHLQLMLSLISLISLGLFTMVFLMMLFHTSLTHWNEPIFYFLQSQRTKIADAFFISITLMNSPLCLTLVTATICILLLIFKDRRDAAHLFAAWLLAALIAGIFKAFYYSPRPNYFMQADTASSFPSGHVTFTIVVLGFLAFLVAQHIKTDKRFYSYWTAGILILLTVVSRIYIGAHWFTDVMGSLFLGLGILCAVIVSYRRFPHSGTREKLLSKIFMPVILIALLFYWGLCQVLYYNKTRLHYAPYSVQFHIPAQLWWEDPTQYLPVYRANRLGKLVQPFNLQWMGSLTNIQNQLTNTGWTMIDHGSSMKIALKEIASKSGYHGSLFPWLYLNKAPVVLFIKHIPNNNSVAELRLWRTNVNFTDQDTPLWIGGVDIATPSKKIINQGGIISFATKDYITALQKDLSPKFETKIYEIPTEDVPLKVENQQWDKEILILREKTS